MQLRVEAPEIWYPAVQVIVFKTPYAVTPPGAAAPFVIVIAEHVTEIMRTYIIVFNCLYSEDD